MKLWYQEPVTRSAYEAVCLKERLEGLLPMRGLKVYVDCQVVGTRITIHTANLLDTVNTLRDEFEVSTVTLELTP